MESPQRLPGVTDHTAPSVAVACGIMASEIIYGIIENWWARSKRVNIQSGLS